MPLTGDAATHLHLLGNPRVLSAKKTAMRPKVSETIEAAKNFDCFAPQHGVNLTP
jgi:hypothetical protein